jgi:hypothetical protein
MQQPLAFIFQNVFQHEVFLPTPAMNAGALALSRHVSHGSTFIKLADNSVAHRRQITKLDHKINWNKRVSIS